MKAAEHLTVGVERRAVAVASVCVGPRAVEPGQRTREVQVNAGAVRNGVVTLAGARLNTVDASSPRSPVAESAKDCTRNVERTHCTLIVYITGKLCSVLCH